MVEQHRIKLTELNHYSAEELKHAQTLSSAVRLYLNQKNPQPLQQKRNELWLQAALATLCQKHSAAEVCAAWSAASDSLITEVCEQIKINTPLALFALGKLGSKELNLSSDIDIVLVAEENNSETQKFLRHLQKNLGEGVFRLDFDLRPGGQQGPLIPTVEQVEDYYGNYGETWERLAFVRLRPLWGDTKVIEKVMAFAKRFSYRKHLDFSLLEDLKILRQKIHSHYWHRTQQQQIDLKLGVGGIRDLELFVHALQVVHGGRNTDLHDLGTEQALLKLKKHRILPAEEVQFLINHYWSLRNYENTVQAIEDRQTHLLIFENASDKINELKKNMQRCDQIVSSLLGKIDQNQKSLPAELEEQKTWLKNLGYSSTVIEEQWPDLIALSVLSRQKERDEQYRQRFLYLFLEALAKYPLDLDRSFLTMKDFLKSMRAKASFYSLFLNHENLIEQMARTFSLSPYFGRILSDRPELIDSLVIKKISDESSTDLSARLDQLGEQKLLTELISGMQFLEDVDLVKLLEVLTSQADQIAIEVLNLLKKDFPNSQLQILALGKWGGKELGFQSDLDLIFVSLTEPQEADLKLAKRWVHRMTEQRKGGPLYSVDFRLKPSGKGGLIVTSEEQLKKYIQSEADAWERQAYLKARWIGKNSFHVQSFCVQRNLNSAEINELERIRTELLKNKKSPLDLKYAEGGLVDIEFTIQILILAQQIQSSSPSTLDMIQQLQMNDLESLSLSYSFLRKIEQIYQLTSSEAGSKISQKSLGFIAQVLSLEIMQLEVKIISTLADNAQRLAKLDPRRRTS